MALRARGAGRRGRCNSPFANAARRQLATSSSARLRLRANAPSRRWESTSSAGLGHRGARRAVVALPFAAAIADRALRSHALASSAHPFSSRRKGRQFGQEPPCKPAGAVQGIQRPALCSRARPLPRTLPEPATRSRPATLDEQTQQHSALERPAGESQWRLLRGEPGLGASQEVQGGAAFTLQAVHNPVGRPAAATACLPEFLRSHRVQRGCLCLWA